MVTIEDEQALYGTIDPLLGYTFSDKFESTLSNEAINLEHKNFKKIPGGYFQFEYQAESNPITIMTSGNCDTDGHLFFGNWPYQLHLLLKGKSIPHIIYNGGVSGYNTSQEVLKVIRDLSTFPKVDFLITYNGFTDIPSTDDTVPNHPYLHPQHLSLSEKITNPILENFNPSFLPNLQFLIGKVISFLTLNKRSSGLSYGRKISNWKKYYRRNLEILNLIAKQNNTEFIHVFQTLLSPQEKQGLNLEPKFYHVKNVELAFKEMTALKALIQDLPYSHLDAQNIPRNRDYFLDSHHLTEKGSHELAKIIHQKLIVSPRYLK